MIILYQPFYNIYFFLFFCIKKTETGNLIWQTISYKYTIFSNNTLLSLSLFSVFQYIFPYFLLSESERETGTVRDRERIKERARERIKERARAKESEREKEKE